MSQPPVSASPASASADSVVNGVASFELLKMIHGDWLSQLIFCAAKLKLPDILQAHGPLSTAELAGRAAISDTEAEALLNRKKDEDAGKKKYGVKGVKEDVLEAVMKCLKMMKIFDKTDDGKWQHGPLSPLLTISHPASVRSWALLNGELYSKMWSQLFTLLVSGQPATQTVLGGDDFYRALDNFPELSGLFDSAMNDMSRAAAANIPKAVPPQLWMGVKRIVDVGGGNGGFARALMRSIIMGKYAVQKAQAAAAASAVSGGNSGDQLAAVSTAPPPPNPASLPPLSSELVKHSMFSLVLDRRSTCEAAQLLPENTVLGPHLQFHAADLYEALPAAAAGADWYVIKNVLHDYSDATCTKILQNIRHTMGLENTAEKEKTSGKAALLVIERLVEADEKNPGLLLDAVFQRLKGETGTVDRNEEGFKRMLEHSGFKWSATVRLPTTHAVIIAYPK